MGKDILVIVTIVVALIVGAGGFFAGMKYQQSKTPSFTRQFGANESRVGLRGQIGSGSGFQPVAGEIISSDGSSVTVKIQDGGSKIVLVSDSTSINKAESGSKEDLKEGEKILVMGRTNSDGSVSAQTIQISPSNKAFSNRSSQFC